MLQLAHLGSKGVQKYFFFKGAVVYRPRAAVLKDADIQVITRPALGGCGTRLEIRLHRGFGKALVGFPARCNAPDLFRESKSMDLKITLWSNNERDDEPLEWNDFVEANRPDAMWGNTQADDFDRALFKPPEPTDRRRGFPTEFIKQQATVHSRIVDPTPPPKPAMHSENWREEEEGRPAAHEEDLSWIDKIADEYLDDANESPESEDLDAEDSGDFDSDDYDDVDTEFLDSLLPELESPVKSKSK
eukprot:s3808_g7.t1